MELETTTKALCFIADADRETHAGDTQQKYGAVKV
jgi:hypothetical protein